MFLKSTGLRETFSIPKNHRASATVVSGTIPAQRRAKPGNTRCEGGGAGRDAAGQTAKKVVVPSSPPVPYAPPPPPPPPPPAPPPPPGPQEGWGTRRTLITGVLGLGFLIGLTSVSPYEDDPQESNRASPTRYVAPMLETPEGTKVFVPGAGSRPDLAVAFDKSSPAAIVLEDPKTGRTYVLPLPYVIRPEAARQELAPVFKTPKWDAYLVPSEKWPKFLEDLEATYSPMQIMPSGRATWGDYIRLAREARP